MLKIFNELKPFFEDTHREISVREFARITGMSPPTASKILKHYQKEGILDTRSQGVYLYFRAMRSNSTFRGLARVYWTYMLLSLLQPIHKEVAYAPITLFGSLAKAENTAQSDVDLFVDCKRRELELSSIEKKLQRKIQIHFEDVKSNTHLIKNIQQDGVSIV